MLLPQRKSAASAAASAPASPAKTGQAQQLANYLPLRTARVRHAVPLPQAIAQAPRLADLAAAAQHSAYCLQLVTPLIAPAMRSAIAAGPWAQGQWCLLVANSAVAAKLRQLTPALMAHLRHHGQAVQDIRIKIAMRHH